MQRLQKISIFILIFISSLLLVLTGCSFKESNVIDKELQSLIESTDTSKQYVPQEIREALSSGTPLAIMFYDNKDQISSQVLKYFEEETKSNPAVEFVKVNVTDPKMSFLVAKFDVGFIPEIVVLNSSGKTVMRKNGWIDKRTLSAGIAAASSAKPEEDPGSSL